MLKIIGWLFLGTVFFIRCLPLLVMTTIGLVLSPFTTLMAIEDNVRTLSRDEWLAETHCTRLLNTCMRSDEKVYIVEDCKPGERISDFERKELEKALEMRFEDD